jgi:acid phosphatase (class A)
MKTCRKLSIASLLLLVAAVTEAAEKKFHYLQPNSIRVTRLLPAPPSVGSDEYISEIDQILAIQATRTAAQIQRCKAEETLSLAVFATVMPDFCTVEKMPKLSKLLKAAVDDAKYFGEIAKSAYQRKRPFREDPRIQPLSSGDTEFAYPSGHATRGILFATILAQLEPGRGEKLLERGREIGWDRVIEGVHHPSDIAAGRVMGQAISQALFQSPAFQADLKEVKEEYGAAKKGITRQPAAPAVSK